jgi:hypothetical protein
LLWPAVFAAALVALGAADRWMAGMVELQFALKALSFYGMTLMLYAAFPHQRRTDLTVVALLWAVVLDLTANFLGAQRTSGWLVLDGVAVFCAYAPARTETLRRHVRRTPDKTFADIGRADRRRSRSVRAANASPAAS